MVNVDLPRHDGDPFPGLEVEMERPLCMECARKDRCDFIVCFLRDEEFTVPESFPTALPYFNTPD